MADTVKNMRLICPNCDAQYEVDDSVIPIDGRDVQCSSCGQTWFQKSATQLENENDTSDETDTSLADQEPDLSVDSESELSTESQEVEEESKAEVEAKAETEVEAEAESEDEVEAESETEFEAEAESEDEAKAETDVEAEAESEDEAEVEAESETDVETEAESEDEAEDEDEDETEQTLEHESEQLKPDDAVLEILREEAALESEARKSETNAGLDSLTDLNPDEDDSTLAAAVSERTARLRGIEPPVDKNAARRDLLPDIEEINSTLSASSDDIESDAVEELVVMKSNRRGFRLGFAIILILATMLFLAYAYAPLIIEKVPASESLMNSYVEKINSLRVWLDQVMQSATDKMSGDSTAES